jgi:polyprenyl-phospho-N-acetylgalactosaminyl synthase
MVPALPPVTALKIGLGIRSFSPVYRVTIGYFYCMNPAQVFVIIPAYNEQEVLQQTVVALLSFGYTVVVVDDGSVVPQQQQLATLPVKVLRHSINLGQGAALQTGMDYALQQGAVYMVHFDADGQHRPEDIPALLQPLQEGFCDVTLGSRFLNKNSTVPFIKRLLIFAGRLLHLLYTGLWLTDAHNGLRAFTRQAATRIRITENRMAHASEILFLIQKFRLRFREVPVLIMYSAYSRSKGQSAWNSIRIFFDLLLHKLFQ